MQEESGKVSEYKTLLSIIIHRCRLLADVFESFCYRFIKIQKHDAVYHLSALDLAWQECLTKTEEEMESLANFDIPPMVNKGTKVQCVRQYIDSQKPATSALNMVTQTKKIRIPGTGTLKACMDGQCNKICSLMVSNKEKTC